MATLIGLLGRSRVGKDTVADYVACQYGYSVARLSTPVKEACKELFGFSKDQVDGAGKDVLDSRVGATPRQCMVWLAETTHKTYSPDFFFKRLLEGIDPSQRIVIPDVRYEADIRCIRELGGRILKISRSSAPVSYTFEGHIDMLHGDFHVMNNGSIEELQSYVRKVFDSMGDRV